MYCTDPETPVARKLHRCDSCGEVIVVGEKYIRWRCYDVKNASTIKMHSECYAMHCTDAEGSGYWEFIPFYNKRPKVVV